MPTTLVTLVTAAALATTSLTGVHSSPDSSPAGTDSGQRRVIVTAAAHTPAAAKYDDSEVVEFFLFGRGPIADAHPDLIDSYAITPQPASSAAVLGTIVDGLHGVDKHFHHDVTLALQARDPYKAESGIKTLSADLKEYAAKIQPAASGTTKATVSPLGIGVNQVALYNAAVVSVGVVVAVALVVSIAGAFLAFYERDDADSDLVRQEFAQNLAAAL